MSEAQEPNDNQIADLDVDVDGGDRLGFWIVGGVLLVGILIIGLLTELTGMGWFGYRPLLYGSGDVYLLNMSDEPLEATVNDNDPIEINAEGAHAVEVVGGESRVVVRNADGEVLDEHELFVEHTDVLIKLTPDGCLAVSDISAFYGRGGDNLEIEETIAEDELVYMPGTNNVIWPREPFHEKLEDESDKPVWIELVGCSLLEDEEFLKAYLDVRLGQRLEKAR